MSHNHDDRVADRPGYLCAAYGCPMIGTMSASTSGGDFMCCLHFGKEPNELQAITVEINRNLWLAEAIRDIRCSARNPGWRETYQKIINDLTVAGRDDLMPKHDGLIAWMVRLETELLAQVKAAAPASVQQPLHMEAA